MSIRSTHVVLALLLVSAAPAMAQPVPAQPGGELRFLLDDTSGPRLDESRIHPEAETFVDPASNVVFPRAVRVTTNAGETIHLVATGSAVRKNLLLTVYAAALYVDVLAPLGKVPVNTIAVADIPRRFVLSFRRDVSGGTLTEWMQGGFETVWKAKPGPELEAELEHFFGLMAGGIRSGQAIELTYLPGEGLYTTVAGLAHPAIRHPEIAREIWKIWLGVEPVSGEMKRGLVRLLEDGGR